MSKTILFTTTNKHKLASASSVLEKYGIDVEGVEIELDEIQSNDPSEVAIDKAEKAFKEIQKPLIVMDSGLFIEDLKDFPGVYTKYILETIGEKGLMELTRNFPNNTAYVQRTIAYTDGDKTEIFHSCGYGTIIQEERGENGWSYDKIFLVKEENKTLAEMTDDEKITVWGDAWDKLGKWLQSNG